MTVPPIRPADLLEGLNLADGWRVESKVQRAAGSTGGCFSVGYLVVNEDGRRGFLKALDYSAALRSADPARVLEPMTAAYNFERDLLRRCRERGLARVATAIADGSVMVPNGGPIPAVSYLIFDRADGDVRRVMGATASIDVAWKIRCLHNVAAAMWQLHRSLIAHQDLKPSNVLVFSDGSKVGDLGRAIEDGVRAPHDKLDVAGDRQYAPPELLYRFVAADWETRRLACDLYHFGNIIYFMLGMTNITGAVLQRLHIDHRPAVWRDGFPLVLPFLRHAFNEEMDQFSQHVRSMGEVPIELVDFVRQLCEPDPALRGHPSNRGANHSRYSLERYVSRLDNIARASELKVSRP